MKVENLTLKLLKLFQLDYNIPRGEAPNPKVKKLWLEKNLETFIQQTLSV